MDAEVLGSLLVIFGVLLAIAFVAAAPISLVFVYRDSEARGKTGCMWVLIAFFTWPLGVLAYYLLRNRQVRL